MGLIPSCSYSFKLPSLANGSAKTRLACNNSINGEQRLHTVVLSDLVPVGLIPVKIMFPIPSTSPLHIATKSDGSSQRRYQSSLLELRLCTRHRRIKESNIGIRPSIERGRRTGEELAGSIQFRMYFNAHRELPLFQPRICSRTLSRSFRYARSLCFGLLPLGFIFQVFAKGHTLRRCCFGAEAARVQPFGYNAWAGCSTTCVEPGRRLQERPQWYCAGY